MNELMIRRGCGWSKSAGTRRSATIFIRSHAEIKSSGRRLRMILQALGVQTPWIARPVLVRDSLSGLIELSHRMRGRK